MPRWKALIARTQESRGVRSSQKTIEDTATQKNPDPAALLPPKMRDTAAPLAPALPALPLLPPPPAPPDDVSSSVINRWQSNRTVRRATSTPDGKERVVELEKAAGVGLGLMLQRAMFTNRIIVDMVDASSLAFGLLAPGDVLMEVNGVAARSCEHVAEIIFEASWLRLT
jgi:hypothetical protein